MNSTQALHILADRGYEVYPVPDHLFPRPGWWISEAGAVDFDFINEHDLIEQAEALHGNHRCYVCQDQAESRCPGCNRWTCWEDRRDFPPNFDEHLCGDCVHNAIMLAAEV